MSINPNEILVLPMASLEIRHTGIEDKPIFPVMIYVKIVPKLSYDISDATEEDMIIKRVLVDEKEMFTIISKLSSIDSLQKSEKPLEFGSFSFKITLGLRHIEINLGRDKSIVALTNIRNSFNDKNAKGRKEIDLLLRRINYLQSEAYP